MFTPAEFVDNYANIGAGKAKAPALKLFLLAVLAGFYIAMGGIYCGQLNMSGGDLAVTTIKIAATKCGLSFGSAFVMGILCNILVCAGVVCSLCGKDLPGRAIGAFVPVCFFILGGFEHCVANMYYIPAGILANSVPKYAEMAAAAGIDTSALTWGNFVVNNLVPVTLGNIAGGMLFVGLPLYLIHSAKIREEEAQMKAA